MRGTILIPADFLRHNNGRATVVDLIGGETQHFTALSQYEAQPGTRAEQMFDHLYQMDSLIFEIQ